MQPAPINIEEMLTLYTELSDEEREVVRAYVAVHPEWASALDEARRWDELLRSVQDVDEHGTDADSIAYYVATRDLSVDDAPPEVARAIREMKTRIEGDPELRARVSRMASDAAEVEAAVPAGAQFERLTGHDLDSYPTVDDAAGGTVRHEFDVEREIDVAQMAPASAFAWRAAASVVALIAVYGILFAVGESLRPQHERLGAFTEAELVLEGFDVSRSDVEDEVSLSASRYIEALDNLRRSRTSFLGLFPSYDESRLDAAAGMLDEVVTNEPQDSFLAEEATYMLAKTELLRGRNDAAAAAFSQVVASGSRRAEDARRILREMER